MMVFSGGGGLGETEVSWIFYLTVNLCLSQALLVCRVVQRGGGSAGRVPDFLLLVIGICDGWCFGVFACYCSCGWSFGVFACY